MTTRTVQFITGISLGVIGASCAVWAQALPAATIRACANAEGDLRLLVAGGRCRRNERLVEWNVQGPQGETGPQGPAGGSGPVGPKEDTGPKGDTGSAGGHHVVDAGGQIIGEAVFDGAPLGDPNNVSVVFQANGATFKLPVAGDGFQFSAFDFYHTAADCSDPGFINHGGSNLTQFVRPRHVVGSHLFYADTTAPAHPVIQGHELVGTTGTRVCLSEAAHQFSEALFPLLSIDLSHFVTPFTMQ